MTRDADTYITNTDREHLANQYGSRYLLRLLLTHYTIAAPRKFLFASGLMFWTTTTIRTYRAEETIPIATKIWQILL